MDGHEDRNALMLVADIANYPIIVRMGYLANYSVVLDTVGKGVYFRKGWCLHTGAEKAVNQIDWQHVQGKALEELVSETPQAVTAEDYIELI